MSKIGRKPIILPKDVEVSINDSLVSVKGKKGQLETRVNIDYIKISREDDKLSFELKEDTVNARKFWGTTRALINNMIVGVTEGFKKQLELNGVGYKAAMKGKDLVMQLGYSHDIIYSIPDDISVVCSDPTHINVEGINKQKVGFVASQIKSFRRPEPYKGKGIKYLNEQILRKEGKKK